MITVEARQRAIVIFKEDAIGSGVRVTAEGSIAKDAPAKGFYQKPMLLASSNSLRRPGG